MLKRIAVHQLRVGMFIEAPEGPWLNTAFAGRRFLLESAKDADTLKRSNLSGVFINTAKGLDVEPVAPGASDLGGSVLPPEQSAAALHNNRHDLAFAAQNLRHATDLLKNMFGRVQTGDGVTVEQLTPIIGKIATLMERNPSILINMTRLKSFDETTFLHSIAVSALMIQFGRYMKFDEQTVQTLGMSGLLHDIGKLGIPIEILGKVGALTDDETAIIRQHPTLGHAVLSRRTGMPDIVLDVCLHHHERLDGKGYPFGLRDEKISLHARMAAICDVYDALTSVRPYKKPWSPGEAAGWMLDRTGCFDRPLLQKFLSGVLAIS